MSRRVPIGLSVLLVAVGVALIRCCWVKPVVSPDAHSAAASDSGSALVQSHPVPVISDRTAATETFTVLVVDRAGAPVAGADCFVVPADARWVDDDRDTRLGVTDTNGHFAYPAPRDHQERANGLLVFAERSGAGAGFAPLAPSVTVVLEATPAISFTCVADDGSPVAGARVALSGRQIPLLAEVPTTARRGGAPSSLIIGWSDADGRLTLPAPRLGVCYYAADHPGFVCEANGVTSLFDSSAQRDVVVRFGEVWVAGVQFEGPGTLISYCFVTGGASETGRSSVTGRAILAGLKARFPNAILTSARWRHRPADPSALLSAWHTHRGWIIEPVPYQRYRDFVPMILTTDEQSAVAPAKVSVQWVGPDGQVMPIVGCSLRTGMVYGLDVDPGALVAIEERLRSQAYVSQSLGAEPVLVPPGTYRIVIPDGTVQAALEAQPATIAVGAGEERAVVLRTRWRLRPLTLSITTADGVEWERVTVTIVHEGKPLNSQARKRHAASNLIPHPYVPVGVPIEIRVTAPDFVPFAQHVVLGDDEVPEVVLQPKRP